jgi:excisionase family DNA binding protein
VSTQDQTVHYDDYGLPVVMTIEEAARFLRISRTSLYELIRQGKVPHVPIGRQKRILRDQLFRWLEQSGKSHLRL